MRVKLLGDHSRVHGGCAAVWEVMLARLEASGAMRVDDESYDVLVVNGEDSIHHDRPTGLGKLKALREAVESGRRAWLINSVWQENTHAFDDVLQALEGVVVREPLSRAALLAHGVEAAVKPDLSWFHPATAPKRVSDFGGQPVVTDFWSDSFDGFARALSGPVKPFRYCDFVAYDWAGIIESLKSTPLLITGRQHAVYAACRARTPFLAVKGNTHKIEGLISMARVDIPVLEHPYEIARQVDTILDRRDEFEELFDWLEAQTIDGAFPDLLAAQV